MDPRINMITLGVRDLEGFLGWIPRIFQRSRWLSVGGRLQSTLLGRPRRRWFVKYNFRFRTSNGRFNEITILHFPLILPEMCYNQQT